MENLSLTEIPQFLKSELYDRRWTQRELAERTGLRESVINRYCLGKRVPGALSLKKLLDAFEYEIYLKKTN